MTQPGANPTQTFEIEHPVRASTTANLEADLFEPSDNASG